MIHDVDVDRSGPLAGVRVVDLTRHMAGPYATVFLSDFGAEVLKVEAPPNGDPARHVAVRADDPDSPQFLMWNRGKKSIVLDFRSSEGLDVLKRLVATSDVFVENYRPGVADKLGLSYEQLSAVNRGLIYVSVSAFGRGPLEARPGTDPIVQAMSGVMSVTGEVGGPPLLVGVPIADFAGAMACVQSVLLGLIARHRSGAGQKIEVSMLYTLISALTTRLATYWQTGETPQRTGGAHGLVMPYQVFATKDGYVVAGVWTGEGMWERFCDAVGLPELALEEKYATNDGRIAHRAELEALLNPVFAKRLSREWEERFLARDVLFCPVYTFPELFADPHVEASGLVQTVDHPVLGKIPVVGPAIRLHETPGLAELPPPLLGEHTVEVLGLAGYSPREIEALLTSGVAVGVGNTP